MFCYACGFCTLGVDFDGFVLAWFWVYGFRAFNDCVLTCMGSCDFCVLFTFTWVCCIYCALVGCLVWGFRCYCCFWRFVVGLVVALNYFARVVLTVCFVVFVFRGFEFCVVFVM